MDTEDYFKYIIPLNQEVIKLKEDVEAMKKALGLKEKVEESSEKPDVTK